MLMEIIHSMQTSRLCDRKNMYILHHVRMNDRVAQTDTQGTMTENIFDYFNFLNNVRSERVFKLHTL